MLRIYHGQRRVFLINIIMITSCSWQLMGKCGRQIVNFGHQLILGLFNYNSQKNSNMILYVTLHARKFTNKEPKLHVLKTAWVRETCKLLESYHCSQVICFWSEGDGFLLGYFERSEVQNVSYPWFSQWDKHWSFCVFPLLLLPRSSLKRSSLLSRCCIIDAWNHPGSEDVLWQFYWI